MRCIKQIAIENEKEAPTATTILREDIYMDDILTGGNEIQEVKELQGQLVTLLALGKFNLRKWRSNNITILENLKNSPETDNLHIMDGKQSLKTLGLLWNSHEDVLQYKVNLLQSEMTTKRKILSSIAQIYDPLGMIGPVIINAKIIMQRLWQLKTNWDERVPEDLQATWDEFVYSMTQLTKLKIQRNINPNNESRDIILHGFCDASQKAYGACIYVVSTNKWGDRQSHLLCSKSRVAPLKTITLPRLELSAAVLLSELMRSVRTSLRHNIQEIHLWSDSTITLYWIKTPPSNLKTFVAHRVTTIQEFTEDCTWHYVASKQNPADHLSRGVETIKLLSLDMWWQGPSWLAEKKDWPHPIIPPLSEIPEVKIFTLTTREIKHGILCKYSSFSKLIRIVAYCYRFIHNLKGKRKCGYIQIHELELARIRVLLWTQQEVFSREIGKLYKGKTVDTGSCIVGLRPFIDKKGLLRVGGRLINANIPEEQKFPIILPAKHHITDIILREEHNRLLHCGPQQLLSSIRSNYWPISGGRAVKRITRSCVQCFSARPKIPEPLMGDLPEARVNIAIRPFDTTGVDYAGPLQMRESRRRGRVHISKAYIAVFTCFATKAVHLELVTDLTTASFLAAFRRFTARRGLCRVMHSDNATNFVGAARELKEVFEFLAAHEIDIGTALSNRGIEWKFIPPRSPHFGGLWEAAVKSTKRHLYTVTKGIIYTFEEYYTLIVEIEAILNSRPLMPMSTNPDDLTVLSPSHFLVGDSLVEFATKRFLNTPDTRLSRWEHIQKIKQNFWKRWQNEYLHHLQQRNKWVKDDNKLKIGTMVLLKDENLPPLQWSLGRITKLSKGRDNIVRVAEIKTERGLFQRCVKKLCILPFEI